MDGEVQGAKETEIAVANRGRAESGGAGRAARCREQYRESKCLSVRCRMACWRSQWMQSARVDGDGRDRGCSEMVWKAVFTRVGLEATLASWRDKATTVPGRPGREAGRAPPGLEAQCHSESTADEWRVIVHFQGSRPGRRVHGVAQKMLQITCTYHDLVQHRVDVLRHSPDIPAHLIMAFCSPYWRLHLY